MSEAKGTGDAERAVRARRPVLYEKLLRAKLAVIRDEAMELQAALEFVHGGDALADDVWQFADRHRPARGRNHDQFSRRVVFAGAGISFRAALAQRKEESNATQIQVDRARKAIRVRL